MALVVLLVVAAFGALAFWQLRRAQGLRLRLLAGFSQAVEDEVEAVARSVSRSVGVQELTADRLVLNPYVTYVESGPTGTCGAGAEGLGLRLLTAQASTYFRYCVPASDLSPSVGPEVFAFEPSREEETERFLKGTVRLNLDSVVRSLVVPEGFDSVVVAGPRGQVLYQQGEPELRIGGLAAIVRSSLGGAGSGQTGEPPSDENGSERRARGTIGDLNGLLPDQAPSLSGGTAIERVTIAGHDYYVFVQPIQAFVPPIHPSVQAEGTSWAAIGVASAESILVSGLTRSPSLLLALFLLPPLALIAWPFLKLALIGPRQRFRRWDVLLLFGGTVLGIFLAVLLVFGYLFALRDEARTDERLERLSVAVNDSLAREIRAVHDDLRRAPTSGVDPRTAARRIDEARWVGQGEDSREDLRRTVREIAASRVGGKSYPVNSLSWVNRYGEVALTLPFTDPAIRYGFPYAGAGRDVGAEDYFRCASRRDEAGSSGICTGIDRSPLDHAPVVVVANRLQVPSLYREWDGGVLAARFRPFTLELPILAPGFELAVVEPSGRVLFHSDARRGLSENLFLAADDDPLLRDLIRNQRSKHLTTTYWGREVRAHVGPLAETGWSLVVYRRLDGGRERLFELAHDYLNLSLLFLVFYGLLLTLLWVTARERLTRLLWPSAAYQPIYWKVSVLTPIAAGLVGFALVAGSVGITFALVFFLPVLLVGGMVLVGLLLSWWKELRPRMDRLRSRLRPNQSSRIQTMRPRTTLALITGSGAALAIVSLAQGASSLVVLAFGLAAGWSVALWWWRSELRREHSRTPYLVAAGGAVTVIALLPAIGFLSLAHERQSRLGIQETQLTLARQWAEQRDLVRSKLRSYVIPMDEPPRLYGEVSQAYLGAFDTEWKTPHAVAGPNARPGDDPQPRRALRARGFLQSLMAARLGTLQSFSTTFARPGLGVSGGEAFGWRRIPAEDRLALSYSAGPEGERHVLLSPGPHPPALEGIPVYHQVLVMAGLLFLGVGGPLLVRSSAKRVLLWPLGGFVGGTEPAESVEDTLREIASSRTPVKRLLVTPEGVHARGIAESAVHEVSFERAWKEAVARVEDSSPTDRWERIRDRWERFAEAITFDDEQADIGPEEIDTGSEEVAADPLPLVLLYDFRPGLEDEAIAADQIAALDHVSQDHGLVIVTEEVPPWLLAPGPRTEHEDRALSRWIDFLARFPISYAHGGPDVTFRRHAEQLRHRLLERDLRGRSSRDAMRFLHDVVSECSATTVLQKVGSELLVRLFLEQEVEEVARRIEEIEEEIEERESEERSEAGDGVAREEVESLERRLDRMRNRMRRLSSDRSPSWSTLSHEQIVLAVGAKARLHYRRLWKNLSIDEKLVLVQLAEEGWVNPKSLPWVADLMNRGLIVKDPNLRVMNESFRRFVLLESQRTGLLEHERAVGSGWNVLKWVLPIPLACLALFLFMTRQSTLYSLTGVIVVLGSLAPFLINLFGKIQAISARLQGTLSSE